MFHPSPDAFLAAAPAIAMPAALHAPLLSVPATGFAAGTLVETEVGWRPVSDLVAGIRLATFDGGFAEVIGLRRSRPMPQGNTALVLVPGGALGNCDDAILGAGQEVLLPTGPAEAALDAAFALVRASDLAGHFGIRAVASQDGLFQIDFAAEEVVWANSGLLLRCPAGAGGGFLRLDSTRARALIGLLEDGTPFPTGASGAMPVAA
jgi:hypothetical protein